MKKTVCILMALLMFCMLLAGCGGKRKAESDIDYLALVNKENPLPEGWEDALNTVTMTNSVGDEVEVEKAAYDAYLELKAALEEKGVYIDLDSARRSIAEQQDIVDRYTVKYGEDYVKQYVAVPGYSEHHTGLALDLYFHLEGPDGPEVYYNEDMVQYPGVWEQIHKELAAHGFILRYLEGKEAITGYNYEPWHIRYVGNTRIAKEIMEKNITLEEYLNRLPETDVAPAVKKDETAQANGPYTIDNIRQYVVGLDEPVELADGTTKPLINFDNAATTPALQPVVDEVESELLMYGSIGRGFSQKSNHSTDLYNETRDKVLDFVGADPEQYTCFYVNNTTDGLNKLASALIESEDQTVLATRIEHHANDLSWRERCNVIYAEVDEQGRVDYDDLERMLNENKVDYVTITAASNVTGYVTDVHRVAKMAHEHGAKIIVDGAQIVAHREFSMLGETPEENIDFFVFSAHKMYSPFGGGAVVGLTEVLNEHMPEFYGGGTVLIVSDDWATFKDAPEVYEAGSPNYPGVVGMGKAIDILEEIGFDAIEEHEHVLNQRLIDGLKQYDTVIIYGDSDDLSDRVGVVTFNFTDVNSFHLSRKMSEIGAVATRRGAFCAHPYVWRLMGISEEQQEGLVECDASGTPGMIRVSFGIYNTEEEVDEFLKILDEALQLCREEITAFNPEY